jgi:dihydrodipicolinate synthase/N-acetylneuraminate lyase
MSQINGVICDALTFFNRNGEIIENINSLLIRHILTNDANAVLLFGRMGDGQLFSNNVDAMSKYIDLTLNFTENRNPLLIRIYGNSTDNIINQIESLGRKYEDLNYMISPPVTEKIPSNAIHSYFENILGSINPKTNIYLINNPSESSRNEIEPASLKILTDFTSLKGLNDSFYNIKMCKSYLELLDENFSIFCGLEENAQNFFQLISVKKRKYSGIVSSISNLVNMCSKLYFYALEDNLLELLQLQEQINDIRTKIYDIKTEVDQEKRGLKYAFLYLYRDLLFPTSEDVDTLTTTLQNEIETISKGKIEATVNSLLNNKQIYQLYYIGTKELYQFQDIINTFSKIDILVNQGKVMKITGPYIADVNTIYKVKFTNSKLVFRFRTSKFFLYENMVKEKLLFPLLDKTLQPYEPDFRQKVKMIISSKTGSYIFGKEKPPIIPVSNLIYYDENKELIPYIFSVQDYIRGKPLFQIINDYISEGKNLDTKKFITVFEKLGEHLASLHTIKFNSFYRKIDEIGGKQKISYSEHLSHQLDTEILEAKKNKVNLGEEIKRYYNDNKSLIEEENEFVVLHNDFQSQNVIVKEDQGVIRLNGLVDFDNWNVGSRAQDFIKIDYLILKPLNIPSFSEAFYNTYSNHFKIDSAFEKKIEIHKLLWLLNEYNYESALKKKVNQIEFSKKSSNSLENYLFEIKAILRY